MHRNPQTTSTQPAGNVTRIELPESVIVPQTQRSRDRRSHDLPLDPRQGWEDEPDAAHEIFPPELRLPLDPGDSGTPPRRPEPTRLDDGAPLDQGQTMPRVQVLVSLAGARALFEEGLQEAIRQAAPRFERIAQAEIKLYDFRQDNKRRAADYRLRGPG